jgi:hypothetical protein
VLVEVLAGSGEVGCWRGGFAALVLTAFAAQVGSLCKLDKTLQGHYAGDLDKLRLANGGAQLCDIDVFWWELPVENCTLDNLYRASLARQSAGGSQ